MGAKTEHETKPWFICLKHHSLFSTRTSTPCSTYLMPMLQDCICQWWTDTNDTNDTNDCNFSWAQLAHKLKKVHAQRQRHQFDDDDASTSSWPGVQALQPWQLWKCFFEYQSCFLKMLLQSMSAQPWHVKPSCQLPCATSHSTLPCSPSGAACWTLVFVSKTYKQKSWNTQTCWPNCEQGKDIRSSSSTPRPDTLVWSCGSGRSWQRPS